MMSMSMGMGMGTGMGIRLTSKGRFDDLEGKVSKRSFRGSNDFGPQRGSLGTSGWLTFQLLVLLKKSDARP